MEKCNHLRSFCWSCLLTCSVLILAASLHTQVQAASINYTASSTNTQLVYWHRDRWPHHYYYGAHPRYRDRYNPHVYHPGGKYWTGWYRIGPSCKKRCLVNRWGQTIRCIRRCR